MRARNFVILIKLPHFVNCLTARDGTGKFILW